MLPFSLSSMAARLARAAATSPIGKSCGGASMFRFASSTSAPLTASEKANNKKVNTDRLSAVNDAVNDRKLPPELRGQRNAIRSETDIVNIVEQRIWHSMEEGHFENLPGKGKPLDLNTNPHADPAEDTLYRILSRNKCAPEWVELNKEIRSNVAEWRLSLQRALAHKENGNHDKWVECSEALKAQIRGINDKIYIPFLPSSGEGYALYSGVLMISGAVSHLAATPLSLAAFIQRFSGTTSLFPLVAKCLD